MIYNLCNITR